jgi:hypothetical protein
VKRYGMFVVLLAGLLIGAKKPDPAKFLPPAQSHGLAIAKYGCDKQYVQAMPSDAKRTAVWSLIVWAEYGDHHKRYWKKTYGTYQIPAKGTVTSSAESARAVGATVATMGSESYDFTPMDHACTDWGQEMESRFKIKPDGSLVLK